MICIYKITNIINNHIYIGSTNNFNKRKNAHLNYLKQNKHHSIYLQRAYNKYGKDNFLISILEECKTEELLYKEQQYIDNLKPEYNIAKSSSSPMKDRKHNENTKIILSLKHKNNKYNLGRKATEQQKKYRSEKRKQFRWTDAVKNKMSETAKRLNSINRINREKQKKKIIDSNNIVHNSISECAAFHLISPSTVCDILKGRHTKTKKGITFKYYENT